PTYPLIDLFHACSSIVCSQFVLDLFPGCWGEPLRWHNFFGPSFRFCKSVLASPSELLPPPKGPDPSERQELRVERLCRRSERLPRTRDEQKRQSQTLRHPKTEDGLTNSYLELSSGPPA